MGQLLRRQAMPEYGKPHHRAGIRVGLDHGQLLDIIRQIPFDPAHGLANIGSSDVEIRRRTEFRMHAEIILLAR